MKFVWTGGQAGEAIALALPGLDAHGRTLTHTRVVEAVDPAAAITVISDRPFIVDHTDPVGKVVCDWLKAHDDFTLTNRNVLPRKE